MMKKVLLSFLMALFCIYPCFGALSDADEAADGYLTAGEYDGSAFSLENNEELIVMGGGLIQLTEKIIVIWKCSTPQRH